MTDLRQSAQQALEACPFCGNEPSFSGNASEWKDDYRYVELSLGCCVSMSEQIGWRSAREMTHKAKTAELRSRLQLRWNTRTALEQQAEPVGEVTDTVDGAFKCEFSKHLPVGTKLYTTPLQRKPLTDEQADQIISGLQTCHHQSSKREFLKVWLRDWAAHGIKEGT